MAKIRTLLLDVTHDFSHWVEELSKWTQVPVGLPWLAASLRAHYTPDELELRIVDVATKPGYFEYVQQVLRDFQPDLVGLRGLSVNSAQLHAAADVVKTHDPQLLVIAGGPYACSSPDQIMEDPNIDIVCTGEGEQVIIDVVGRVSAGSRDFTGIRGIYYRQEERIERAPPAVPIANLDSLPFPDYTGLDLSDYWGKHPHTAVGRPYASLVCSRGCPYGCIFCNSIFGRKTRHRSPENIAAECQQLYSSYGIRDFIIGDDGFNVDLEWAKAVLRAIHRLQLQPRIFFGNGLRGDNWDEEFLDLMAETGVVEVFYAIETASERLQKILRKRLDLERVERALAETSKRGMITNGFFMIGIPSETPEETQLTVDFIKSHAQHLDFAFLSVLRAYEGTPAYEVAKEMGYDEAFLRKHASIPYCMQVRVGSEYNFIPYEVMKKARLDVALTLYSAPRMKRVLERLRRVLDEEEVVMKFASYLSAPREAAVKMLRSYDSGVIGGQSEPLAAERASEAVALRAFP